MIKGQAISAATAESPKIQQQQQQQKHIFTPDTDTLRPCYPQTQNLGRPYGSKRQKMLLALPIPNNNLHNYNRYPKIL